MVRLTDRPDMTLDVYRGRKTTIQSKDQRCGSWHEILLSHIRYAQIERIKFMIYYKFESVGPN